MTTEVKLNFLLMGTTGQGKSATGNTLLNKRVFKATSKFTSETKEPSFSFAQFENKVLLVVDGPGLADTDMKVGQDREAAAKNCSQALAMCYGGVNAFLFVIKYGNKFTLQETAALEDIKKIFGDNFMEHMIVVVTCGDKFQEDMEEEDRSISFDDWCKEQRGAFQKLYKDCRGRVVLFNNKERDEKKNMEQRRRVVEMAEGLTKRLGLYTSRCFKRAESEREKMIIKQKAPLLNKEILEQISVLTADIENLLRKPSESAKTSIRARVQAVKEEIKKHDRGYGILVGLLQAVETVESKFNDIEQLLYLAKEIEKIRGNQKGWGIFGTACTVGGGALALVAPPAGLAVGGACAAATGIKEMLLYSDARKLEQAKKELEKKIVNNKKKEKETFNYC